jgi:PAS domain S-box-containing protein
MKHAPVLAFIKDAQGRYIFVNRRVEESYGRPLAEWVGKTDQEIFTAVEANEYQRNDREVLETGKTSQYAETSYQSDGRHDYLAFKFRLENEEGEHFVAGMTIDVTALRKAEDALRVSEERIREQFAELHTLYRSTPHGLCLFDLEFRYRRLNERLAEMNGIPLAQHLGRTPYDIVPDLAVKAEAVFRRVLEKNEPMTIELPGHTAADPGSEYVWLETWFPVRDEIGGMLGVAVVIEDITERKRMEEELKLHREQLQVLVEQRTAELEASRRRLQIAERMASLGTLSAGLGHDMGNLLVPVRVRLESLTRMQLPQEAREDLLAIRSSAEYLQRLANGLRLLALDPKRSQSQNATELHTWLAEAVTVLKNVLPRGMSLETQLPQGECWVNISKAALMQVVFNLVQNAGDAMRAQATGVVSITATRLAESIELRIRDTGPGMSEEVRRRCMEPFFTTKSRGISTGLGLALVFGLVQDAGGRVQVESEPGTGTEFILSLRPGRVVTSISTGERARAVVSLRDARQRAIVTTELRSLQYEVEVNSSGAPDAAVVVTDSTEGIEGLKGKLIVLAERPVAASSAVVLGARPKIQELRSALRRIQEPEGGVTVRAFESRQEMTCAGNR